ncbi:MAG: hypothetical protein DMF56_11955 [Acidobacteria bacterium]|nr:MAG: hypothetical protein DMF56_11955 [Acidobacteriota bacterium]
MRKLMLILLLTLPLVAQDHENCPMHAKHVAEAGDRVMGFSHDKTTHNFRLLEDGGAIEARSLDANDAESVAAIRTHLKSIAKEFTAGDFAKPVEIHGRMPDGAETMKELGDSIEYRYEEIPNGARVRITAKPGRARDAVQAFLRFQIGEHHTGDPVSSSPAEAPDHR